MAPHHHLEAFRAGDSAHPGSEVRPQASSRAGEKRRVPGTAQVAAHPLPLIDHCLGSAGLGCTRIYVPKIKIEMHCTGLPDQVMRLTTTDVPPESKRAREIKTWSDPGSDRALCTRHNAQPPSGMRMAPLIPPARPLGNQSPTSWRSCVQPDGNNPAYFLRNMPTSPLALETGTKF